jgi:hypothetical protein
MRHLKLLALLALAACQAAGPSAGPRHLAQLCDSQRIREEYLDFYWDDLRSHQPELWAEALEKCRRVCPQAVNCAPVLSVASWYQSTPITDPRSPR